jgi:hypothetical protein
VASVTYDLFYLQAAIELLEDYLLAPQIYWSLGVRAPNGDPPYPMLTLGGIQIARKKTQCCELNAEQSHQFHRIEDTIETVRLRWRSAWEGKATLEFHSRLMLWRDFLHEYRRQPAHHVDRYRYEVNRRAILMLLFPHATGVPSAEKDLLQALDKFLSAVFVKGGFIWEADFSPCFPLDPYWFLWGKLRE